MEALVDQAKISLGLRSKGKEQGGGHDAALGIGVIRRVCSAPGDEQAPDLETAKNATKR